MDGIAMVPQVFRPDPEETVSLFISLVCITMMSVLFGRKTAGTKLHSINYARGLVVSLYLVSWAFSFMATILVQTNNLNTVSCTISIFSCIILYAISKIIIYLFLMEKVYVVTAVGTTRRNFLLYKINIGLLMPYAVILFLMIYYRVAELNSQGHCMIGLKTPAALSLILYDIFISSWLTTLFIRPLMSSTSMLQGPSKSKLRDVARRTLMGSIVALILSSANVFTLVFFNGHERGLICLASCTMDVTLNAITVHWVTNRGGGRSSNTQNERSTNDRRMHAMGNGPQLLSDKQVGPIESHISVTVESYVEQYHQQSQIQQQQQQPVGGGGFSPTSSYNHYEGHGPSNHY